MFVAFNDSNNDVVIAVFDCRQSIEAWPNQGEVDEADARLVDFYKKIPEQMQASIVAVE